MLPEYFIFNILDCLFNSSIFCEICQVSVVNCLSKQLLHRTKSCFEYVPAPSNKNVFFSSLKAAAIAMNYACNECMSLLIPDPKKLHILIHFSTSVWNEKSFLMIWFKIRKTYNLHRFQFGVIWEEKRQDILATTKSYCPWQSGRQCCFGCLQVSSPIKGEAFSTLSCLLTLLTFSLNVPL